MRKLLRRTLSQAFIQAVRSSDQNNLASLLRAFVVIPPERAAPVKQDVKASKPVSSFCKEIVRPFLSKVLFVL